MFEYFQPDFDGAEGILFVRDNQGVAFSSNDLAIVDGFFPSHKEVFGHAQEWGSFNSEDDPGVCLLNLCVQRTLRVKDEAHRGQCLAYLREQRALLVAELDSPDSTRSPEEVARLDVLYWYVACAEIMD